MADQQKPNLPSPPGGQFGFMSKIGATDEAVRTLNDQPYLFTILVVVLISLILEGQEGSSKAPGSSIKTPSQDGFDAKFESLTTTFNRNKTWQLSSFATTHRHSLRRGNIAYRNADVLRSNG
ncbi:hypothetical protein F4774DRAFT_408804 [Daldinia eschscholtzii]|nr:hypothetical protein F4774DRAFT_408804 [Daldinia eschscholtzii]